MTFSLMTLMGAAVLAQQQSVAGRVIYITVVPEGLIVQGQKGREHAAIDIPWPVIDMNDGLLTNAVRLVADRLP